MFEFKDFVYRSFLMLPTAEELNAPAGTSIAGKKWGEGTFHCGQAGTTEAGDEYVLEGNVLFRPGVELSVSAKGKYGQGNNPGTFLATGIGLYGPTKGAVHHRVGWVFPDGNPTNGAAAVLSVKGAIIALRGPDTRPEIELGGMPAGNTVGMFIIEQAR